MRKSLSIISSVVCIFGFANIQAQSSSTRPMHTKPTQTHNYGEGPGYGKQEHQMQWGYSAPARIDCTGGWDFFAAGSFIYWHISQQQMEMANTVTGNVPATDGFIIQEFEYEPGFKAAVGTNFGHDNWTGRAEYTRIHGSSTVSSEPPQNPVGQLLGKRGWMQFGTSMSTFRSKWDCDLDMLDGELARSYYSGCMLTFRPFAGVRAAWLDQRVSIKFTTVANPADVVPVVHKTDSWLLGPRAGMDGNWILGCGFRLTGNAAASLLYQSAKERSTFNTDSTTVDHFLSATVRQVTPNAELGMGIGWGSYFTQNVWHFDLYAAYEFHYFWNQNIMRYVNLSDFANNDTPTKAGDLFYHGLTLTAKFDF